MNINLPNGKTISVSLHEWLFVLGDDEVEEFYKECMADDIGSFINDPFAENPEKIDLDKETEE